MGPNQNVRVAGPYLYGLRPGSDIGGEVYERELLERLPAHGIALRLGLPRGHRLGAPPPPGVEIDLPGHDTHLHWTVAPRVLVPYVAGVLRRHDPDLLRGHSVRGCGPSLLLGRAVARSRTPIVLHHHHFTPRWRRLEAAILRRADAVVTVSQHSRGELVRGGVAPERIHVVSNGVARPAAHPPQPELWPDPAGLRLLHVGRLEPRKRPRLALETLAELYRRGQAASLLLAGDGPERAELQELSRTLGISARVRFLGRVEEAHKWRLVDSAELLLFGSTLEGFGLVVAEAQSRGLPVLAAAGTATSEALLDGESGLLADPHPAAFTRAIEALAADPDRLAAMRVRAAEFGRRFDWDLAAAGVATVYRELAGRPEARC